MQKFFENVFYGVGINDVIDILIVAFVIYKLLGLIKQTRAEQLMKGVVVLVVATFLSGLLNLHTINWLLKGTVALGAVAILVVFQPELRRALEYMGRSKIVKAPLREMDKERGKQITSHIVKAVETFSRDRVGVCGRMRAAAYQEQYDKQGTGYETPRRHRHYRKFRCADDHSIGGDRDNFDGKRRAAFEIPRYQDCRENAAQHVSQYG